MRAGLSVLRSQWWKRTGCILADEMVRLPRLLALKFADPSLGSQGLGKTVQIITFLSLLNQKQGARPFLEIGRAHV